MKALGLEGFEAVFEADPDPWRTFEARDEAIKRRAILRALGPRCWGRVLELGAGNGSNSVALARRSLSLDATDGADAAVRLIGKALDGAPGAQARRLALPARPPRPVYDAVVLAEVLYYLTAQDMAATAREVGRVLRPGGVLVLAHHRIQFHDFAQHAAGIHRRFLRAAGGGWEAREVAATRRWTVLSCRRSAAGG